MNKPSPLIYVAVVAYILGPSVASWVMNPEGQWYRPFALWLLVVVAAYAVQKYRYRDAKEQKQ